MRISAFILDIQERFDVVSDHELAMRVAKAMDAANKIGYGFFTDDAGNLFKVFAKWKDGCISGDCNPATCYTNWELTQLNTPE